MPTGTLQRLGEKLCAGHEHDGFGQFITASQVIAGLITTGIRQKTRKIGAKSREFEPKKPIFGRKLKRALRGDSCRVSLRLSIKLSTVLGQMPSPAGSAQQHPVRKLFTKYCMIDSWFFNHESD
ncbi:hypothetical protein [Halothiobacillus sp.]|uniref:hypothetical protein n=1 Tax=Halothiobacillus sp. TaxID=1891311 RepID=UPI0026289EC4|nr:hypothetical protein [Halothiobacillus sp.]